RLVHACAIEVADLLLRASARRGGCRRCVLLEDLMQHFAVPLRHLFEAPEARILRRQRMGIAPLADSEAIEVVARIHRGVHAGQIEAVRSEEWCCWVAGLRGCWARGLTSDCDQNDRERQEAAHRYSFRCWSDARERFVPDSH